MRPRTIIAPTTSLLRSFCSSGWSKMLVLSETDVRQCLDMTTCLQVNRQALIAIATPGAAIVPNRLALEYISPPNADDDTTDAAADWTLFKPASASLSTDSSSTSDLEINKTSSPQHQQRHDHQEQQQQYPSTTHMGMKVVSVRNNNYKQYGLPLVPATVLHMNPITGIVDAVVAATYLTAARTAAGSALSAQLIFNSAISRRICQYVTIFGAGLQAETHIHALTVALGYPIEYCTIINRSNNERAMKLSRRIIENGWVKNCSIVLLHDAKSIDDALLQSDCIITTTNSVHPLWEDANNNGLKHGCHIIGIGSYTPDMQEVPSSVVNTCSVYIDTIEAKNVGDLKHCTKNHPIQLLGNALRHNDEYNDEEQKQQEHQFSNTFYKSVGTAIQDVLTADAVVRRARELGIGTEVDMS